ncbi:MAG: class I SAM-dependent methyltransferase [Candidatus Thorarchaeota archaeon]
MVQLSSAIIGSGILEIRERLKEISGGRILDIGTCEGGFINTLMKTLKNYDSFVGIDISEDNLDKAWKEFEGKPVEFIRMNAEELSFEDKTFDTVCISFTLHHLENINPVLKEARRVLKPNGLFIIQEMISDGNQSEAQHTDILIHHWDAEVDAAMNIPHFETFLGNRLKEMVRSMEFSRLEVFEASRPIKCLFCDKAAECDDPRGSIPKGEAFSDIDKTLERAKGLEDYERHLAIAESLKRRVEAYGSSPASYLFFIAG